MHYPRKRFHVYSRRYRLLRVLKIYLWRAFYILFLFIVGSGLLFVCSQYFRNKVLDRVEEYSVKFDYVVDEVEVQNTNSADYCVNLAEQELVTKGKGQSIFLYPINELKEELELVDCINKISVHRMLPSKIKLSVSYKEPIAIWQDKDKFYFVTSNSDVMEIRNNNSLENFVIVNGTGGGISNIPSLMQFLAKDKEFYSKVSIVNWIGDRRWNIVLNDGTKVILPEVNPAVAWNKFIELQTDHPDFKKNKYKTIDFRVPKKIYTQK